MRSKFKNINPKILKVIIIFLILLIIYNIAIGILFKSLISYSNTIPLVMLYVFFVNTLEKRKE